MKRFSILLLVALALSALGIVLAMSRNAASKNTVITPESANSAHPDPPGTIDGAKNPEMIPDTLAYTLLFDLLSNRHTEVEKGRAKAYIRQAGIEGADVDALLTAAEEFRQRAGALDAQAASLNIRSHTEHPALSQNDVAQLKQLEKQRESLAEEVIASLPRRLSADGMGKLRQHVNERVKRKTKIFPDR
ncbi:MAG: hypothetical protein ABR577_07685 [Pyrinomonadaceae bacterium]